MKTSKFGGAGAVAVGAATAAAVFVLGSTAASADPAVTASAEVLRISGLVNATGTVQARAVDGRADRQALADVTLLPALKGGISATLLEAEAQDHAATATVAKVNVLGLVKAAAIKTWCDGDEGGLDLVDATILGTPVKASQPNTVIDVSPLLKVELNTQTRTKDSLTVTGVAITVLPGGGDLSTPLTPVEKAAVPQLAGLLGRAPVQLPALDTVGDLVDALGATPAGNGLLKVVIDTVTCTFDAPETAADEPAPHVDEPAADEPATPVAEVPPAHRDQAPPVTIVEHHLPVTG